MMKRPLALALSALTFLAAGDRVFAATPPPKAAPIPGPGTPVARVAGQVITTAELAAETKGAVSAAEAKFGEEVYGLKSRALDAMIEKRVLEAKAKKEGITVDALLEREVTSKVAEPAESELQAIYDRAKAAGRQVPPFAEAKAEITGFVKDQQAQQLRQTYVATLRTEAGVETLLPPYLPPRADVKADGPVRGDARAPVTIVEFSDYECGFCKEAESTMKRILDTYKGKVRVVYQNYPLAMHPSAPKASEAALCAGEQGKYWEMHDALFANQQALGVDNLKEYARTIGLEPGPFDSCLDSGRKAAVIAASKKLGDGLALDSTPTFYVNGLPISGAQPFEKFKTFIDHEISSSAR